MQVSSYLAVILRPTYIVSPSFAQPVAPLGDNRKERGVCQRKRGQDVLHRYAVKSVNLGTAHSFLDCGYLATIPSMARMARVVAPGILHYVTVTGQSPSGFFSNDDYQGYLEVMAQSCSLCTIEV